MKIFGVVLLVVAVTGCDKLKAAVGKDADGGAASSSSSSGGLLSFLDKDFEGELTMTSTNAKRPQDPHPTLVIAIKKPKYRVDMNGATPRESTSALLDLPTKKATLLIHATKMAMVMDLDKVKEMKGRFAPPGAASPSAPTLPSDPAASFTNTGKKDTVAGYTCDVWKMTSGDGRHGEACMAEGITWFDLGDVGGLAGLAATASIANHFPLRVVQYDKANAEESRFEAQKIEKKTIDDARFAVPTDYRTMDMATMMNGLVPPGASGRPGLPPGFVPPTPKQH